MKKKPYGLNVSPEKYNIDVDVPVRIAQINPVLPFLNLYPASPQMNIPTVTAVSDGSFKKNVPYGAILSHRAARMLKRGG